MKKSPIELHSIDHLVIRVKDLDQMLAFYCDVLGCTVERHQEQIGLVQLRAGEALIDLVPVEGEIGLLGGAAPGTQGRNMDHFCLKLKNFDSVAITQYLKQAGCEPGEVTSRYGSQGQGPSIYVPDPEKNVVELRGLRI